MKNFQFVVYGILLMICPVLYLSYWLGAPPEAAQIVLCLFMLMATIAGAYMLRNMIDFDFKVYFTQVILKIAYITVVSFSIPLLICFIMPVGWLRFFVVSIVSVFYSILVIYFLGLDVPERMFIKNIIRNKIKKTL